MEGRRGNIKKWGSNSGRGFSAGVEGRRGNIKKWGSSSGREFRRKGKFRRQ